MNLRRFLTFLVLLGLSGCAVAPFDYPRESSVATSPTEETVLRQWTEDWLAANPGPSGFYPLISGHDALGARLALMDVAEKSIDAQYFMMKGDVAGHIFAATMIDAADRGVRVRFLLDDVFTTVSDEELELLDAHPNIEMRLYNPIARRGIGVFNFLADFHRANRRMHNKSFIVDNQVAIVGGRNIADEYFELNPKGVFLDLDVIGVGPIAAQVSAEFDEFWNDSRSLPMAAFASRFSPEDLIQARADIDETMRTVVRSAFNAAVNSQLLHDLIDGRQALYSARAEVITDHPSKLTSEIATDQEILVQRLAEVISCAEKEVIVFTPYFVPQEAGVAFWESIVSNGVRVIILTNSLASNNHTAVHAGYAKYRKPIIQAGVELYEARVDAVDHSGGNEAEKLTLHTKAMVIDREIVFVGSLNLDPRSIEINSEMGVLIHSAELGEELADTALQVIPSIAYRVELNSKDKLQWRATIDGEEVIETSEPLASGWRKFSAFLLKIVPDSQL